MTYDVASREQRGREGAEGAQGGAPKVGGTTLSSQVGAGEVAQDAGGPAGAGALPRLDLRAQPAGAPEAAGAAAPDAQPPAMRVVFGVQIIGNSSSARAVDECAAFVTQMISRNRHAQRRLQEDRVTLVIIPHDKKMTDLPQFAALRGTTTFDGRVWDDVRGSGGMRAPDGSWAIGVPEENLTAMPGVADSYGPGYSVGMHEFAHTLHSNGLTSAQRARITQLYAARQAAGGPWTEAYGASNEQEYFAQCTNCYYGRNAGIGQNGRDWLRTNDQPMFDFLEEIYGRSFDESGNLEPTP